MSWSITSSPASTVCLPIACNLERRPAVVSQHARPRHGSAAEHVCFAFLGVV